MRSAKFLMGLVMCGLPVIDDVKCIKLNLNYMELISGRPYLSSEPLRE